MEIFDPEMTQDELNRHQIEIAYRNAGQIKHAANVFGIVFLLYLAADLLYFHLGR